ncbi:MAG: hypothetical protein Q8K63_09740 [Acidimicrobiales bacterium]|nr:hypothetical protein [Acidimicrobiales bacterium]
MARRLTARQRRARVLVIATVLSLFALGVNAIANGGGRDKKLEQMSYLDEVRPLIADSSKQGADLLTIRDNASDLGRPGTRQRLEQVVKETQSTLESVKSVDVPGSADAAQSLLVATLQLRVIGARSVVNDMIDALSAKAPAEVVDRLVVSGRNLIAADQTYKAFTDEVAASLAKGAAEAVGPSVWIPEPEQWEEPELTAFVNILKANSSVAPVVDVSTVLVKTTPAAVGKEGEKLLLPKTGSVRLEVVVANIGNVAQKRVTVTASLQPASGGLPDVARDFVDLSPGKRRAISFRGLKAAPGDATLIVTIGPLPGETSIADNTIETPLVIHS